MTEIAVDLQGASKITASSVAHLRREISLGKLKARKNGARVIILRSDLEKYIEDLPTWTPGEAPTAANDARRKTA